MQYNAECFNGLFNISAFITSTMYGMQLSFVARSFMLLVAVVYRSEFTDDINLRLTIDR